MKRMFLAVVVVAGLLAQVSSQLDAAAAPALSFFKNYLITGDYAVQGIGLRGTGVNGVATGEIVIPACEEGDSERLGCVPKGVDISAAFLYWQAVTDANLPEAGARGVQFHGQSLSRSGEIETLLGKRLGLATETCPGLTTRGGGNRTITYRADVLRFLEIDPATGKTAGYGAHRVSLPDSSHAAAVGASLVIVYRDSSLPYSAIVLYDGAYTMSAAQPGMSLGIEGFYEADDVNLRGKLSHIASSGPDRGRESIFYNGVSFDNPFTGAAGPSWNNPTYAVDVDPSVPVIQTGAGPGVDGITDCVSWAAVVYRTPVNDDDGDGLLNLWERSATPVKDPYGRSLPLLSRMGANPTVKDIFVEINFMKTEAPRTYGTETHPAHSHAPDPEAIRLFGEMFRNRGINVHVDLGPTYGVGSVAEPYLVRDTFPGEGLARGGEAIDEDITVCERAPGTPPWACQFSAYPGTLGWKTGLRRIRDSFVDGLAENCDVAGSTCARVFDQVRMDIFRYAVFSHFIGLPKSTRPCLDSASLPIEDVGGVCPAGSSENPDFRAPRTYSGVADFPGGDMIVSLGGFKNSDGLPVGTPFMQASTLAHEFGHTAERRHGGDAFEPNCKPGYLSVMNYLYQLRGLMDDSGTPALDFAAASVFADVDESAVQEGVFSTSPYRLGWYAPIDFSYLKDQRLPARSRCDGSPLAAGERMVRIDARTAAGAIDWNGNDVIDTVPYAQDVNFNGLLNGTGAGAVSGPLVGSTDDWSNLRLNQVGSRRNVGGLYRLADGTLAVGPLSLDVGKVDLGPSDLGKVDLDLGKVDLDAGKVDLDAGKVDLDFGKVDLSLGKVDLDAGKVDLGKVDLDLGAAESGSGDLGRGDFGGGDLNVNDPENPLGEIDTVLAADLARTAPNTLRVCVVGASCVTPGASTHDVAARFLAPHIGGAASFTLYRVEGATLSPGVAWTAVGSVVPDPGKPDTEDYLIVDPTDLVEGAPYTYFVVTNYAADGGLGAVDSEPSNLVTIVGAGGPPSISGLPAAAVVQDRNTTSTTMTFTVADTGGAAAVALSGSSSNPALLPDSAIVFGGSEGLRTVTLTPVPGQAGSTVVTIAATDGDGLRAVATLTFRALAPASTGFAFVNVKNAPAAPGATFKAGSAIPLQWRYTSATAIVDSSTLTYLVTVAGPGAAATLRNPDPGRSGFRYKASSKTWSFNLQTRETTGAKLPAGTYVVTITPSDGRYATQAFNVRLVN